MFTLHNLSMEGPALEEPYRNPRFMTSDQTKWPKVVSLLLMQLQASKKLDLDLFHGGTVIAKVTRNALRSLPIVCIETVLRDLLDRYNGGKKRKKPFDVIRAIKLNAAIYQRWVDDPDNRVASPIASPIDEHDTGEHDEQAMPAWCEHDQDLTYYWRDHCT